MAKLLHKLGLFAFKNPWIIISGWVVILGLLGFTAHTFMKPTSSEISIPGTEAQRAIDRVSQLFPNNGKGSGRIVFKVDGDKKIADFSGTINALTAKITGVDGVILVTNPLTNPEVLISKDGRIAYAPVQFKDEVGQINKKSLSLIQKDIAAARTAGIQIESGGALIEQGPSEILGPGEIGGVVIALVVLFMTLGSLIAAGMPILVAVLAVGISTAALFSMSQLFAINTTTPVLGVMLGLAVGIDYSLFIINRYRMLLIEGRQKSEAVGRALGTAGNAVVFAAATVIIALAALSIVGIPFMTMMGLAGAGGIFIAALVAISLIPALLGLAGDRVFSKKMRARLAASQKQGNGGAIHPRTIWRAWGEWISRHPWVTLVSSFLVIAAIAWPVQHLALGLPTDQYQAKSTTERKAYEIVSQGFGVGYNGPLTLIFEHLPAPSQADEAMIRQQVEATYQQKVLQAKQQQEAYFAKLAGMATTPQAQQALQQQIAMTKQRAAIEETAAHAQIEQTVKSYAKFVGLKKVAEKIGKEANVSEALPVAALDNGTAGIIQVIPGTAPSDKATINLIKKLRDPAEQKSLIEDNRTTIAVTGSTALQDDINAKLAGALPQYLLVVVGLSLVLLVIAFHSLLIPIKATLGFLLSVSAMFGAMVAVFQWGWFGIADAPGPIISFIPIISIGVLFGLAMDYEFFLVSSMQEEYHRTGNARSAVTVGFGASSRVVMAAAVIMISVFAGFITNSDPTIQPIGFGLALGILIDAFIVRMMIVPAVMTLLGKSAWWVPKWLKRILPRISIEGEDD